MPKKGAVGSVQKGKKGKRVVDAVPAARRWWFCHQCQNWGWHWSQALTCYHYYCTLLNIIVWFYKQQFPEIVIGGHTLCSTASECQDKKKLNKGIWRESTNDNHHNKWVNPFNASCFWYDMWHLNLIPYHTQQPSQFSSYADVDKSDAMGNQTFKQCNQTFDCT